MGSVLIQLLPLVIGSMLMPTWIVLVLSLLTSEHGSAAARTLVGGMTVVRVLQGFIFGFTITAADGALGSRRAKTIFVSTLLLVTGILMLAAALKQLLSPPESDTLIARWMTLLSGLTPLRAFGLGALLVATSARAWLFTLTAIGLISQAELGTVQSIGAFLLYVLAAELLLIVPILIAVWAPKRFATLSDWLLTYDRAITIVVSLVVGSFFLWYGVNGLIR